jgi:hypothetical protein
MNNNEDRVKLTFEDQDYFFDEISDAAKENFANITFTDLRIAQLRNELAISNTARNGYLKLLKEPVPNSKNLDS